MRTVARRSLYLATVLALATLLLTRGDAARADGAPGTWTTIAPMPTARVDPAAVGTGGRVYAIGGKVPSGNNASRALAIAEAYDLATKSWVALASLPTPRSGLAAVAGQDGRIYAIGGASGGAATDVVEAYSPTTNTWARAAPLPTPRWGLAAVAGPDGRIYAIGGLGAGGGYAVTAVEAYTPRTNTWATAAPVPVDGTFYKAALGGDSRIYVVASTVGSEHVVNTVEAYDPARNSWTPVTPMPGNDAPIVLAAVRGEIYAITATAVMVYSPGAGSWVIESSNVPNPLPAGAGAGTAPDGRIYLLGGSAVQGAAVVSMNTAYVYTPAGPPCRFVLGFATLHDLLPDVVGTCLDNESHNPVNGDGLQHTSNGLLVWRKADNNTAFTDGYRTWVSGPRGIQERLNTQRFIWEANPAGLPIVH